MGWLIEMLIEGIQEKCSQFIIDMMEIITEMFTELLSCNLNLFEELFSVVGALYKSVIVPLAIALLLLILTWQLFKSMFGKVGLSSEDPIELIFRSGACLLIIVGAKTVVNYVLTIAGTPYQWVVGTDIKVNSFSEYVSSLEGVTAVLGIDSISTLLLTLIMQLVVAWNYFKMLFIVAERYVLLGVFSYTAPLAFATGGSRSTNNILSSWAKMFGGQIVLIIMNAWCMKMFLSGYGNMLASGYGFTKFFVATLCLVGFCKITFKLDTYMASLGVNLGRPSGGIGAMGLVMAANRFFSNFGGFSSGASQPSGGSENHDAGSQTGAQDIPNGFAQPIPMSPGNGTESGGMEDEREDVESSNTGMEDVAVSESEVHGTDTENVLEILGETPTERTSDTGVADAQSNQGVYGGGEEEQSDISSMQEILENGNGGIFSTGNTENYAVTDETSSQDGQNGQNGTSEENIMEVLNQGSGIDGLGDYPVERGGKLKDEGEDGLIGTAEVKNGAEGLVYEQTLAGSKRSGETGRTQGADILHELGESPSLDISSHEGTAAVGSLPDSMESTAGSTDINLNADSTSQTTEEDAGVLGFTEPKEKVPDSETGSTDAEGEEIRTTNPVLEDNGFNMNILEPVPEVAPEASEAEKTDMITGRENDDNNTYPSAQSRSDGTSLSDGEKEESISSLVKEHASDKYEDDEAAVEDVPEMFEGADGLRIDSIDDEEDYPK